MIERPLMTPDELKSLPKGQFIVMKTGEHPMKVRLKLFFKWGIEFDKDHPYTVAEHGNRIVKYADKNEIVDGIIRKYGMSMIPDPEPKKRDTADSRGQSESMVMDEPSKKKEKSSSGGNSLRTNESEHSGEPS